MSLSLARGGAIGRETSAEGTWGRLAARILYAVSQRTNAPGALGVAPTSRVHRRLLHADKSSGRLQDKVLSLTWL